LPRERSGFGGRCSTRVRRAGRPLTRLKHHRANPQNRRCLVQHLSACCGRIGGFQEHHALRATSGDMIAVTRRCDPDGSRWTYCSRNTRRPYQGSSLLNRARRGDSFFTKQLIILQDSCIRFSPAVSLRDREGFIVTRAALCLRLGAFASI
jgi:hypothetical protein